MEGIIPHATDPVSDWVQYTERDATRDIPFPSALLAATEPHRAFVEILALRLAKKALAKAPRGDGHPVMILPGFLSDDVYNMSLRRFLGQLGYASHGWGLGRNMGPRDGTLDQLQVRLEFLQQRHGCSISLIGHSLGGIYARELARLQPDLVRQVISLGSPFGEGREAASYPARLFAALNPEEELPLDKSILHHAPPVPTTAVYSRGDGVVNWQTSVQSNCHPQCESVRVRGSHCGMTLNPTVWYLVAQRLAQPKDTWQPFECPRWAQLLFPR